MARMRARLARWLLAGMMAAATVAGGAATCPWPDWEDFRRNTISVEGRVVDASSEQSVTVSEGQAYGLFFALVANDRPMFDKLLGWTEDNLARGDLTAHLPAWIWGKRADGGDGGTWGTIDANPASDADLWIAYTLLEAGRLWQERRFTALGSVLAGRILQEETAQLPALGRTLLPGPVGFQLKPDVWRLNPSYVPLQLMRCLATALPEQTAWTHLVETSARQVMATAPLGFSPDWVEYHAVRGFQPDTKTQAESAYNAIRVYLWAGMLAPQEPLRPAMLRKFEPLADFVATNGYPPERLNTQTGMPGRNAGNAGFSAAVVPLLIALGKPGLAHAQAQRTRALAAQAPLGYYSQVLALFGLGYLDRMYRFDADGALVPAWKTTCPAAAR